MENKYKPHPDYTPGPVPSKGNRVIDTGRWNNSNAGTRGMEVQKSPGNLKGIGQAKRAKKSTY